MTSDINKGRVAGKVALVTGAASGIGKAAALALAGEGAKVAVTDLNVAGARVTANEIVSNRGDAATYSLDVTLETDWERVLDSVLENWNRLDILVNNAGISFAMPVEEMSLSEWQRVMAVNLDGVFLGTKHAVRAMRKGAGGSIINVASASGLKASAGASAYCASKAAVRMFSKAVALECAQNNDRIRVNTVFPSGVISPMWESMPFWQEIKARAGSEEAAWQVMSEAIPLKRFARPEEIAQAILYLATDDAGFVTGADFVIDGGFTL